MTFVFGDTLICDDAESAKAVTFHPQVGLRSVTIQGDVYDPSGTISGGSAPSSSGLLVKVQALKRAEAALQEAKDELGRLEHEEQSGKAARDAWTKAKRDLEMKQHEVKLLEEQVTGSNAAMARTCSFGLLFWEKLTKRVDRCRSRPAQEFDGRAQTNDHGCTKEICGCQGRVCEAREGYERIRG